MSHIETPTLWYFAYGSNMARAIFVETRRMEPLETLSGWLDGYRLSFNIPIGPGERGVANVIAEPDGRTHGVVYQLTHADFERLDASEGVSFGLYRRIPVNIVTAKRGVIEAWTYRSSVVTDGRKPSLRYRQLLIDGARENELPLEYLQYLEALDLALDERVA